MAVIKLKYPVIFNDEQVDEITIPDRLKLKHMKEMDKAQGEIGKIAALIASMADLPMSAVDQIDVEDFNAIAEVAGGFLGRSPAIGVK
ncbi:MAG TPA: phage tail assembly protein [Methylobacter sp.]|jgi:hypothetical protein